MKTVKYKLIYFLIIGLMATGLTACLDDLNTIPLDEDELVSEVVFGSEIDPYKELLAKIYAGLAISGNSAGDVVYDVFFEGVVFVQGPDVLESEVM